ncbi:MAG: phosphodiester glycosidase family protein [Peptococcaceae bacterium]|jgi:exopolysaccharide biosynthesis protein|nr:phosphodiester glycosidase family protein [Peptococcaceae bacterium]
MVILFLAFNVIFAGLLAPLILFWGPFDALKIIAVGSVYTSRHPQVVQFFLSEEQISNIMHAYDYRNNGNNFVDKSDSFQDTGEGITIEDIEGKNYYGLTYKGKVMLIKDPTRIKVAVTSQLGITGERLTDIVAHNQAIAGINAGGFYDPAGKGNGAYPDGIAVHNGEIIHNSDGDKAQDMIAFDAKGKLILETLNVAQIKERNIREGVSFYPNLIKDGKSLVSGDGGWGMAPRTGIGQTADGTVIFVVIDGRQPLWSSGAALSDLVTVFKNYGAVTAANLDGGSTSEMIYSGKILNKLWNIFGERYMPTAFVVTTK